MIPLIDHVTFREGLFFIAGMAWVSGWFWVIHLHEVRKMRRDVLTAARMYERNRR